ncbi:hypothetical protein [Shewanella frigidimarina]|uniref:hypothetical protein n=1 Tax=Shewanella frigidimarina TaxID=56812 RepID=UPI003D7B16A8
MHDKSINSELIKEKLHEHAFLFLEPIYSDSTIDNFNCKFECIFSKQKKPRRYVDALDIYKLGLIEDVFTPKLISLIYNIFPEPILYHCHSYEIDGFNSKPHISNDNFLDGWHRDMDCIHDLEKREIQHVSLFVYLTNVGDNDGAFEICDKKLGYFPRLFRSSNFYSIKGNKGSSFLFNRTAIHRASANENAVNRRVLKISFQSKTTLSNDLDSNTSSHDKGFKIIEVQKLLPKSNLLLRALFGDKEIKNSDVNLAIKEVFKNTNMSALDSRSSYRINTDMNLLSEFRGYVRDCFYVNKLLNFKIKRRFAALKTSK